MGIFKWFQDVWASRPSQAIPALERIERTVFALSKDDAERQVVEWFGGDPEVFITRDARTSVDTDLLPESVREFFREYPAVEIGELRLGGDLLSLDEAPAGKIFIGTDIEHARVVADFETDTVWVLEPNALAQEPDDWPHPYPSLSHYLLITRETREPNWWTKWPASPET